MKYHYQEPDISNQMYGESVKLQHPAYTYGTLFRDKTTNSGIVVVEQHFDEKTKHCYWGEISGGLANDIYLCPKFKEFFEKHARVPYPIFQVRSIMWQLRMKPLEREPWEVYF